MEGRGYAAAENVKPVTCSEPLSTPKRKKKTMNKRRFSDEQIRLLESMFELETKLEPTKKVQIARELELQPRQVAIWFQNRRARWKSKQIEQDYTTLRADYDNLASRFESLKKENQSLLIQFQKLSELQGKPHNGAIGSKGLERHSTASSSDCNGLINCDTAAKPSCTEEGLDCMVMFSDNDHQSKNIEYSGDEGHELLNMSEHMDCSLASPGRFCSLDSSSLFDQSSASVHWWRSWS